MNNITKKFNPVLLASIVASTLILSASSAGAFERGEKHKGHGGGHSFNRMDTNQDSMLSLDEMLAPIMAKSAHRFARKDSDENGLLSLEEFMQTRHGARPDLSDIAEEIIQCVSDIKAETDNENIIIPSASQFLSPTEKFALLDSSTDGFISLEEVQQQLTTKVTTAFASMDVDQNGLISEEEFRANKGTRRATRDAIRQCIDELHANDIG